MPFKVAFSADEVVPQQDPKSHRVLHISSRDILHVPISLTNTYLPYSYLPSTTSIYASVSKGAACTIFYSSGMVWVPDLTPQPPTLKADALPTELLRP